MFKRIDHTEFVPADFEKTLKFYTEVLGAQIQMRRKIENRPPMKELVFIKLGDTMMELFSVDNPLPVSKDPWRVGYRKIAIQVENVPKAVEYLKSKGVEIVPGPAAAPGAPPPTRAEIKDPDGISIELLERN